MAESEEELKRLFYFFFLQNFLMNVKEESEKSGLKLNIQETKILVSGPMSSWQIQGKKKMEAVTEFIFLGSKITADDDHSYEIKRCLLNKMEQKYLGKKYMTNIDSVLKSRNNILPTKIHIVKAMFFPAVIYECESRTIKKAEC